MEPKITRMTSRKTIETIRMAQAEVEWEHPLDYAAAFDEAIDALELIDRITEVFEGSDSNIIDRIVNALEALYNVYKFKKLKQKKGEQLNDKPGSDQKDRMVQEVILAD